MIDSSDYSLSQSNNNTINITDSIFQKNFWRWFTYLTLLSLGGGISYAWYFATEKLNPLIEQSLSNYLSRPVKLGEIEFISLNSIRVGESAIETTPTENDSAIVEEIIINFNPLQLLSSRELNLDINLNQGKFYLQQEEDNSWLQLNLNDEQKELPLGLNINVNEIKINNSDLFVKNNIDSQNYTQVNIPSANIIFQEDKNLFNLQGKIFTGGEINLTGFNTVTDNQWLLKVNANNILTDTFNQINLIELPLQIKTGKLNSNLTLEFKNEILDNIEGKINLNQVDVSFPQLAYTLTNTNGEILLNKEEITLDNIQTNLGLINANVTGVINQDRELNINAHMSQSLTIDDVIASLELPSINLETEGKIKGNVKILGDVNKPIIKANITNAEKEIKLDKIPVNEMTANLTIANSQVNIEDLTIKPQIGGEITGIGFVNLETSNSKFNLDWQGKDIDAEKLLNLYQQTLPIPLGKIDGNYNLSGDWQDFQNFQLTGVSNVTLPQGEASVKNLQLNRDSWLADIEVNNVGLKDLSFLDCEKLKCQDSLLDGEFNLQGKTHNVTQDSLKLRGNFSFNLQGNQVALKDTFIENNNWQTNLEVYNFPLPDLASFSDSQNSDNQGDNFLNLKGIDKGKITAGLTINGDLENNDDIKIEGEGKINLPQGEVKVTQIKVEKDNFIAKTVTDGFSLSQINNLSGEAKGDVTIRGNLNSLSADSINLDGNLVLTEGIGFISQPINVSFGWNGKHLQLNQAVTDNIQARGIINLDTNSQQIKDFDLDVSTQQMSLSELSLPSSLNLLNYQGNFNFRGKLTGNLSQPQLTGNVTLNQLEIANVNFSTLEGGVSFSHQQGLDLTLNDSNGKNKFALKLDSQYQPLSLDLRTDTGKVTAWRERETDNFNINLYEIPLEKVTQVLANYFPSEIKEVGGILSGEVNLNLDNYDITASSFTIKQPSLNHLRGDILTSELRMTDNVIEFINGNLRHQENEYQFTGELVSLMDNPQLQLAIEIKDGDIQNLLSSWEFFEFSDISQGFQPRTYASAKDLYMTGGKIKDTDEGKQQVSSFNPSLAKEVGDRQNEDKQEVSLTREVGKRQDDVSLIFNEGKNQDIIPNTQEAISVDEGNQGIITTNTQEAISVNEGNQDIIPNTQEVVSLDKGKNQPIIPNTQEAISVDEGKNQPIITTNTQEAISLDKGNQGIITTNTQEVVSLDEGNQSIITTNIQEAISVDEEKNQDIISNTQEAVSLDEGKNQSIIPNTQKVISLDSSDNLVKSDSDNNSLSLVEEKPKSISSPLFSINSDSYSLLETFDIFHTAENTLKVAQRRNANGNLPSLDELRGKFSGIINLLFSVDTGVKAEFDFRGNSWQWGKYDGNSLQVTGSYNNELLTFLPVIIQSNDTILSLTGTFQPERISGEITLTNFPFSQVAHILNLPDSFNIEGNINSSIAISGSEVNPLARGNIEVVDAQINNNSIEKTSASFGLRNSRIDFLASSNLTHNDESLRLIGSLPFQVFPNSLIPDNNNFKLDINLTRNGFGLLDVLSNNQLTWLDGDGNIDLNIQGIYYQNNNAITDINAQGIITLKDASIDGNLINNQLISNINGKVLFDFSELNIPSLTGDFNGADILITGSLPLVNSPFNNQFLTLNIDSLPLNIDSFYQGNASANLNISGSAIAPYLGGEISLYDGKIELTNQNKSEFDFTTNNLLSQININNLALILRENIIIDQAPILNLNAQGEIRLSGRLNDLKPEGVINLKGGSVNLFTSRLSLANNYNNTAKFIRENGFNPYLDLRLQGSVTETNRYQFVDISHPNEIRDFSNFSINTAQTVKVKAEIKGWSNNLENNIRLSSSPQRNETEIIALLGGGFFNNLTEGNGNLDLANLASAAFLGGVQGEIQKAFGFDELRLFPTQVLDTENRTTSLGLGAELALDLTDNFSVSVMKILTNEQAPRYSVRYRLNEQTIFRGSSDFEQDTRGVFEFEHRF